MVVKNVSHSEDLERKRDQENVVRWIATLNHVESASQKDPPGIQKLPKQCGAIFVQIPKGSVPLLRHRVPVDMNTVNDLVLAREPLSARTQHGHVVAVRVQRSGFLPHTRVKRNRQVFYDNKDLAFQSGTVFLKSFVKSGEGAKHRCLPPV